MSTIPKDVLEKIESKFPGVTLENLAAQYGYQLATDGREELEKENEQLKKENEQLKKENEWMKSMLGKTI